MRKTLLALLLSCGIANAYTIDDCNRMLQASPAGQAGCKFDTYAASGANNRYCNFRWDCKYAYPSRPVPQTSCTSCGDGINACTSYYFCPNLDVKGYIYSNPSCKLPPPPPFPPHFG